MEMAATTRQRFCEGIFRRDLTGSNPTDRGKLGTKRHVLTDKKGVPLSVVITAANTHDMKAATNTLDSVIVERPLKKQNLCLDKGDDFPEIERESTNKRRYILHIRHRGEEKKELIKIGYPARRWVVERTNSWHNNRFRKLLIRYEKKSENYLALVCLACCIIV